MGRRMGSIRTALQRFGRRLTTLISRPRRPGPVADVESGVAASNGETVVIAVTGSGAQDGEAPSFRNRARLRRRLRYLRQTRELGFRDLGGFMFDSRRFGRDRGDIVEAKLDGLTAIDREVRALEVALDDAQEVTLLREPGISVCPRCGGLHGSEDNYCSSCGLPVGRGLGLAIAQGGPGAAAITPPPVAPATTAPASTAPAPSAEPPAAEAEPNEKDAPAVTPDADTPTSEASSVGKQ